MRTWVLWGGPEDGTEKELEEGVLTFFTDGPLASMHGNVLQLKGRYAWNSITRRFEWMGYE